MANKFEWSTECKSAVTELKKKLLEALVLRYPNDGDPYALTTDVSMTRIGAILTNNQGTLITYNQKIIAYASKTLSKRQQIYSTTKLELFALFILQNISKPIYLVSNF